MKSKPHFLFWPIIAGLLFAIVLLQLSHQQTTQTSPEGAAGRFNNKPMSYAQAVKRAAPSVVNIYTSKVVKQRIHPLFNDPFFRQFFRREQLPNRERIERSLGSGVIISQEGYLLTNNHVIAGADEILVLLQDGRESLAKVVGTDPDTDIAVLHIELPELSAIPLGDPADIEVGDVVLAIGNPFGFGQTVTQGIISAINRYGLQLNTYENFIQTDAAINPGNSGGALIDANGYLLGINAAIYSKSGGSQGIGLAIPVDYALKAMRDLIDYGRVIRGWLGIEIKPMPVQLTDGDGNKRLGLMISQLSQNGPAAQANLLPGDIILSIDGDAVDQGRDVMFRVAMTKPGEVIDIAVVRQGKLVEVSATVGTRP